MKIFQKSRQIGILLGIKVVLEIKLGPIKWPLKWSLNRCTLETLV